MMRAHRWLPLLIVVAMLSCSDDDRPTSSNGNSNQLPTTDTPEGALELLAYAYQHRDIDLYDSVIDLDFEFVPSTNDPDIGFLGLSKAEDHDITERMFEMVEEIQIRLENSGAVPSDRVDFPSSEGYLMIQVPNVYIEVTTREIIEGSPLIYLISGDPALFIFKPDTEKADWKIVFQQDQS